MKPQQFEKWALTIKTPSEELTKKYKALLNIKKAQKEQLEESNLYPSIINEQYNNIFYIIAEKISKMPTSTFEKVLTLTSSAQQLNEYLEILGDLFAYLEKNALKEMMRSPSRIKLNAILFKLLDFNTKKEYRFRAFQFLLRILNSYDNLFDADKEYICLFNYALEHPILRENSQKPAYCLQPNNNPEFQQNFSSFHEMTKVITENPAVAKTEESAKDIFTAFTQFLQKPPVAKTNRAKLWFIFFTQTWKDIFFNSQGVEETNTLNLYIETKKKAMTINLTMLKLYINLFEIILKDPIFVLSKEDLFLIMDSMKYFYWDRRLQNEVNKILKIFHDFVSMKIKFHTDKDFDDAIRVKLISTLDENCYKYFLQEFMQTNINSQDSDYIIISQPQENLCLSIFNELIKQYDNKYSKDIFAAVKFALEKASAQIGNPSKDYLYPLLETVLLIAIKAEPTDRPEFEGVLKQFMEFREIAAKVNEFMLKKTESFICTYYNDANADLLPYMEIVCGSKVYSMKTEYLIQFLLQRYCEVMRQKKSNEYHYFENEVNGDRVLIVKVREEVYNYPDLVKILETLQLKFNEWITCLVILYNLDFPKSKTVFPHVWRGICDLIQKILEPDSIQAPAPSDRVKVSVKPKYPLPTETLYQIFGHYFVTGLPWLDKSKYEVRVLYFMSREYSKGRLWAIKAYLKIFCNTQSEIPTTKSIIIEIINFVNSAFKSFYSKEDDPELFMTVCIVLKYSEQIFLTDYPGIKILIPNYLKMIEYVLTTEKLTQLDQTYKNTLDKVLLDLDKESGKIEMQTQTSAFVIKNAALNVLKSILFMGYVLADMKIINILEAKPNRLGNENMTTMEMIREKGFLITYKALERLKNLRPKGTKITSIIESSDVELQFSLFTLSTIIVYLECHPTTKPRNGFGNISVEDFIDLYLQEFCFDLSTMPTEHLTLHVQAIGTLASMITDEMQHYTKIFKHVVSTLTSTLTSIVQKQVTPQKKDLASDLFFALLKWLLNDKTGVLIKEEITLYGLMSMMTKVARQAEYHEIFEMFFANIFVNYMNFPFKNQQKDNTKSIFEETTFKHLSNKYLECLDPCQKLEEFEGTRERSYMIHTHPRVSSQSEYIDKETSLSKLDSSLGMQQTESEYELDIQDTNESKKKKEQLLSLFDFINIPKDEIKKMIHMREKDIISCLNNRINNFSTEIQHPDSRYFTFRDNTLISAASAASRTIGGRILFRNMTGRFAWEFSYLQALDQRSIGEGAKRFDDINRKSLTIQSVNLFQDNISEQKTAINALNLQLRAAMEPETTKTQRDIFREMFEKLKEHVSDFAEFNLEGLAETKKDLSLSSTDQFEIKYEKAKDLEEKITKNYKRTIENEHNRIKDMRERTQFKKEFPLNENILKLSNFDGIRMLFSHLGFLSLFKDMELGVFENNNDNLQTTVNLLDGAPARETIKIGVIYVSRGQDNQRDILKNTYGSDSYEDFIAGLGQRVSLRSHLGFQAGLKYKADGETAIYHSDALTEVMFHVATMMPTEAEDDQVLNKKKHVGNDHVNIIWCENYRGYRMNTITTQFNFVQIVIYPIKFDLFKVVLNKKNGINFLFPWIDNMIISKEHLPLLVKLCAAHGFRKSRTHKDSPFKAYQKRMEYLKQFSFSDVQGMPQFKKKTEPMDIISSLLLN